MTNNDKSPSAAYLDDHAYPATGDLAPAPAGRKMS